MDEDKVDYSDHESNADNADNANDANEANDSFEDLFGGEVSDDEGEDVGVTEAVDDQEPEPEQQRDEEGERDEEDERKEEEERKEQEDEEEDKDKERDTLFLAKAPPPGPGGAATHLAKVPHFLGVDARPFDAASLAAFDAADDEARLRAENTVRWRYANRAAASMAKDSNARVIRWSDGSFSLLLNNEVFDCTIKSSLKANHYLASKHPAENVLQTHLKVKSTVMFVSAKNGPTFKRMNAAIVKKHKSALGTRLFTDINHDPVQARKEAEKREREAIQAAKKMQAERQKTAMAYGGGGGGDRGNDRYSGRRYEEFSDDDTGGDRARRRPVATNLDAYEEDFVEDDDVEEAASDSEDERRREEKLRAAKRSRREDDEPTSSAKKPLAKRRVIDDSDDD